MIKKLSEILEQATAHSKKTVAVAVAQDKHVLEAIISAKNKNIVDAILVGDVEEIKSILTELGQDLNDFEYVNETDPEAACAKTVELVVNKKAECIMKGLVDTRLILKAVLNKEYNLKESSTLNHVAVMEIPSYHKLFITADSAMNLNPTFDQKVDIIDNCLKVANAIGIKRPKVGVCCAVEKVNEKMPATIDAQNLVKHYDSRDDLIIGGPFALDNLVSKESSKQKGIEHEVAGDVDIIIHHTIEQANTFYKSCMFLSNGKTGGVIVGAKCPIILTSRADSSESKLYSIGLAAVISNV